MHGFGVDARNYRHGHKPANAPASPEYLAWLNMKSRCNNPDNNRYHLYGKLGVQVCGRWLSSFESFLADVGPRPSDAHSIDRYPNKNGNYEPTNVRWATDIEQSNNRRSNRMLTFDGETHTMAEWARIKGLKLSTVHARLKKEWTIEMALSPVER